MPRRRRSGDGSHRITVLLADAQPLFARRLAATLDAQPDMAVVAQSSDGDASVRRAGAFKPDVAVVDAGLVTGDRTPASEAIADASPETRVLVLVSGEPADEFHVGRDVEVITAAVRGAVASPF